MEHIYNFFNNSIKKIFFSIKDSFCPENDGRKLGVCIRSVREIPKNEYKKLKCLKKRDDNYVLNETEYMNRAVELLSYPSELRISIETRCNFNPPCVYCDWEYAKRLEVNDLYNIFSLNVFEELGLYYENAIKVVDCSYGEPFLHPDFKNILNKLDEDKKHFEFTTNGSLLNNNNQNLVLGKDIHMYISIDANNAITYSHYRNNCFDLIVKNLIELCKRKKNYNNLPEVTISFLAMKSNYHEIEGFIQLCKKIGVDSVKVRFLDKYNTLNDKTTVRGEWSFEYKKEILNYSEIKRVSTLAKKNAAKEKIDLWIDDVSEDDEKEVFCDEPWKKVNFLKRGIMPCCFARVPLIDNIPTELNVFEKINYTLKSQLFGELRGSLASGDYPKFCKAVNCPMVRQKGNNRVKKIIR